MTIVDPGANDLLLALRQASGDAGLSLEDGPRPLNAQGSVQFVQPGSTETRLAIPAVIRLCDRAANATREAIIEDHLYRSGFPTPPVLLIGSQGDALGGAWLLIELVSGPSVRIGSGRGPVQAARSIRALWQRPALLAELTARLHGIDPDPVDRRLANTGSGLDWHKFLWDRATSVRGSGAAEVVDWLERNEPEPSRLALSHGDLHPGNIVISANGPQIIDWGIGCLAPPARDIACTMFALLTTGSQAPGPTGGVFSALGRQLSDRFLRRYRALAPIALPAAELDWHRVLYSMNRVFWATLDDEEASVANSGDPLAVRAARADGVLDRELPIHARIIDDITGVDLLRDLVNT